MTTETVNAGKQTAAGAYNAYWQEKSAYRPLGNYTPVPADFDIKDSSFQFSDNLADWPWANDPCNVLYNEKDGLYYSWILYRDKEGTGLFSSDWMEMVSEDCINWRQTEKRLEGGVHAKRLPTREGVTFMGGSAWIDKKNRFGFGAGAVLFFVSMMPCRIGLELGGIQAVALFVAPGGLGTPVDTSKSRFIFHISQALTDWRDTRLQWDEDNNQLIFAISNHSKVQFYVNASDNISAFKKIQVFDTGYLIGIECPDFRPILDSASGEKYWLLTVCKQNPDGGIIARAETSQQTVLWYLGRWNGAQFTPFNSGILEYGHDFYAPSVSEPRQSNNPYSLIMRGYLGNWGYIPDALKTMPVKGFAGGSFEDREIYVEDGVAKVRPLIKTDKLIVRGIPPVKSVPTWMKVKFSALAGRDSSTYALQWDSGDMVALDMASAVMFDISKSGAAALPGKSFAPMPLGNAGEMEIFLNGSCLSFYANGKQACFQIFPRGKLTGLKYVKGARKVENVKYYDMSPLFA